VIIPKAILFDLDDTLTDRKATLKRFVLQYLEDFKTHLEMDVDVFTDELEQADSGGYRPRPEMFGVLLECLPWKIIPSRDEFLSYWVNTFPRLALPMPGMLETLETLQARGLKLGIITNGHSFQQQTKIDALEIRDLFEVILVSAEVNIKKPDAQIYQLALEQLEVEAFHAWMVGDHVVNDVLGARGAGLAGVWLRHEARVWDLSEPSSLEIRKLPELLDLLE
jgi:putative hydrolase of the HAD superfamily